MRNCTNPLCTIRGGQPETEFRYNQRYCKTCERIKHRERDRRMRARKPVIERCIKLGEHLCLNPDEGLVRYEQLRREYGID